MVVVLSSSHQSSLTLPTPPLPPTSATNPTWPFNVAENLVIRHSHRLSPTAFTTPCIHPNHHLLPPLNLYKNPKQKTLTTLARRSQKKIEIETKPLHSLNTAPIGDSTNPQTSKSKIENKRFLFFENRI